MSGLYLSAGVVLDDDSEIRVHTGEGNYVAVHISGRGIGGTLSIQLASGDNPRVADRLLAAVTEWHAEIHRRGHGQPITPAPEPASP